MAIIFNTTEINELWFNGVQLQEGWFNGVLVFWGGNGLFYGGATSITAPHNTATRINASGDLIGSETNVGTARSNLAGATVGGNGLFYGGYTIGGTSYVTAHYNTVTIINASGALVGSQTSVGTARNGPAGATVGGNGLFYGGYTTTTRFNTATRINASGDLVGSQTSVGTARLNLAGATVGGNGLFYGGAIISGTTTIPYNTVTRINASGALVDSETNVSTATNGLAGATVGGNGLFYGGGIISGYTTIPYNTATRINASGALVGSQTSVGTARYEPAGATV